MTSVDPCAKGCRIPHDGAIRNRRPTAVRAVDTPTVSGVPIGYGETLNYGICVFSRLEYKSPMIFSFCTVAVNYAIFWAIFAAHRNRSAEKVNISVAIAGINTVSDKNRITVIGIVDGRLNVIKLRSAIVINVDYSCLAGNGQKQQSKAEKQLFHLDTLFGSLCLFIILAQRQDEFKQQSH